jgi:uncharacterized protein (DUF1330 family)
LPGVQPLADGEAIVMEGPWPFARTALGYVADTSGFDVGTAAKRTQNGYAVQGMAEPGSGNAFAIAAHKMLDVEGFRPYAETIPGFLEQFAVRSLARGGRVTPLGGAFAPERAVVLEFPSVEAAVAFYTSEAYAPLLALRLRTTDPRFIIMSRAGNITAPARDAANAYLAAHPR